MEMLKKLALALLVLGSCGLQAMRGFHEPDVLSTEHMSQHPDMYYTQDGYTHLLPEHEHLVDELIARRAEAARLNARLQAQARRQGISVGELTSKLQGDLQIERNRDTSGGWTQDTTPYRPSTMDELLDRHIQDREAEARARLDFLDGARARARTESLENKTSKQLRRAATALRNKEALRQRMNEQSSMETPEQLEQKRQEAEFGDFRM